MVPSRVRVGWKLDARAAHEPSRLRVHLQLRECLAVPYLHGQECGRAVKSVGPLVGVRVAVVPQDVPHNSMGRLKVFDALQTKAKALAALDPRRICVC